MRIPKVRTIQFRHFPGIALSILLLSLLTYLLGWSTLLSLKSVTVTGTSESTLISQSIAASKPSVHAGIPLARINVRSLYRTLSKNEWISSVEIGRSWIHGSLTVAIHEREPVAKYQGSDGVNRYFDINGVDFQSPITYSNIPAVHLGSDTVEVKSAFATFLTSLHQIAPSLLTSSKGFSISHPSAISMQESLSPSRIVTVIWGSGSDLSLKVNVLNRLLALKENAKAQIFDISDPLSPLTK